MQKLRSDSGTGFHMVRCLPVTAAVREVLALLQLRLHQGTTNTGVAVSVHPVGEPRARDADLFGVRLLHHPVISVRPRFHRFHRLPESTGVLEGQL